jgi:hypothetical protein
MQTVFKKLGQVALTLGVVTLVACGGDSSPALTVSGVAATGLAIDGGSVVVQCVSGTGTATTQSNGAYSVSVTDGQGPCLITVTKGAIVLRSITPKTTTGTAVANVTPISNAIVTALVQAKGAATPAALVSNAAFIPSNENLTRTVEAVLVKINLALVAANQPPLAAGTDLLGKPNFVAATTNAPTAGDALDKALDVLVTAEGSLPADLATSINSSVIAVVPPAATGGSGG